MSNKKPSRLKPRAWQRMLSGRRLDLLDPSPFDIEIEDIAHGLARVARWNGQTLGDYPFTVAQHSVIVRHLCQKLEPDWPEKWLLAALLHDAPEYVIGDMISPFKTAIGLDYRSFEERLSIAIHMRFGLPSVLPKTVEKTIKQADRISAYFEAVRLAGFEAEEAKKFFGEPSNVEPVNVEPLPTPSAQQEFMDAFDMLVRDQK